MPALVPRFHPVSPPVELDATLSYQEYSCHQSQNPSPGLLEFEAMHGFGVVYRHDSSLAPVMSTLEAAYAEGGLVGVILVDVQDAHLLIIVGNEVLGSAILALERSWASALEIGGLLSWTASFTNQKELLGSDSELEQWMVAKKILSSASFDVNRDAFPILDCDSKVPFAFSSTDGIGYCSPPYKSLSILKAVDTECMSYSNDFLPNMNSGVEMTMTPASTLSNQDLQNISNVVLQKHSLRDQCLYALLLALLRPAELLALKVSDVTSTRSEARVKTKSARLPGRWKELVLAPYVGELVSRYINENTLSEDDFLFPSRRDNKCPMNAGALVKSFRSWLRDANIDPSQRSLHSIRNSALLSTNVECPSFDASSLRHNSKLMTAYYTSATPKESDLE